MEYPTTTIDLLLTAQNIARDRRMGWGVLGSTTGETVKHGRHRLESPPLSRPESPFGVGGRGTSFESHGPGLRTTVGIRVPQSRVSGRG